MPKTSSIRPVIAIEYRLVTDRWMDGQTDTGRSIYHTSIVLHGKSNRKCVWHVRDNVSIIQEAATAW